VGYGYHAVRAGVAVLFAAILGVAGCSSEPGTGPALSGPQQRAGSQDGTAAPKVTVITPVPIPTTVAPLPRSAPVRVVMPSIGVDSRLMRLGIGKDGKLEVPPNGFPAGWFTGAPTPGERGPAIIAGHVHWARKAGVFARLAELKPGDRIRIARADRSTAVFRVTQVKTYRKTRFPGATVYGDLSHPGLRIITCGGLNESTAKYDDNVVVFADLVR
jgi:LPXTG-site transpeptidase (sortase) family protein